MCNRNWFHNQDEFPIEWEHKDEETAFLEERFYAKAREKETILTRIPAPNYMMRYIKEK